MSEQSKLVKELEACDLKEQIRVQKSISDAHYENYCEMLKRCDALAKECQAAQTKVAQNAMMHEYERVKLEGKLNDAKHEIKNLNNALREKFHAEHVEPRPEPSRLEIAAMLLGAQPPPQAGSFSGQAEHALRRADALIAAAKEVAK